MNSRILFLAVAAICAVAAIGLYVMYPGATAMALLFTGVAILLGIIGLTRKAPST